MLYSPTVHNNIKAVLHVHGCYCVVTQFGLDSLPSLPLYQARIYDMVHQSDPNVTAFLFLYLFLVLFLSLSLPPCLESSHRGVLS